MDIGDALGLRCLRDRLVAAISRYRAPPPPVHERPAASILWHKL
jgi:hypothetical protein